MGPRGNRRRQDVSPEPTGNDREKYKHDPSFNGPLSKRSCTDIFCLLIFIVFICAWIVIGVLAFKDGNPEKLLTPRDSFGLSCGVDPQVKNMPYLVFFDIKKCAHASSIYQGCSTPQVCVTKCPDNWFAPASANDADRTRLICKYNVTNVQSWNDAQVQKAWESEDCARWYLPSTPVLGRCLPREQLGFDLAVKTALRKLYGLVNKFLTLFLDHDTVTQYGTSIVNDLAVSWPWIVGALGCSMVVSFIYIILMRWMAGIMVYLSLFGVLGLLAFGIYESYRNYDYYKNNEIQVIHGENLIENKVQSYLTSKNTWLGILIVASCLLAILLLIILFLRNRIRLAVALIREASKAVGSIISSLFFPLFPWILSSVVLLWFIAVAVYLISSGKPMYQATGITDNCDCDIKNGSACTPDDFQQTCTNCPSAKCLLNNFDGGNRVTIFHVVNVFGVFWGLFFVTALSEMVLASTFATWYWTFKKGDVPFFTVTVSFFRTLRYHIGTLAFGSLILAICRMIRVILEYIDHKLKKYDNAVTKCILCCLKCFFWCLENFIKFLNRNAYIMCAIHGKNFCRSAKDAFNLLMRNVIRVVVLDKVADFLLFFGKVLITAGMMTASYFLFNNNDKLIREGIIPKLNYTLTPMIVIGVGTYFVASIFFSVYSMAVDTLFLCFLEDCERNDGSPQKPYYMSKNLMKILGKRNK